MPTFPSHSGPVTLADWTRTPRPSVLRQSPLTLEGDFVGAGGGWKGTVDYRVPIKDVYDFAQFCGGNPYTVTVGGGTATRYIPLSHPDAPALICTGIKAVARGGFTTPVAPAVPPTGPTVATSNWSDAQFALTFTSVPFLVDGSTPFLEINRRAGSEQYTLAGSKLVFPSDGSQIDADAGVTVPTVVYTMKVSLAYTVDDTAFNPLLGCVNDATFLGQPAGTVRFDGYGSDTTMTAGGQIAYSVNLLATYRPVPWNQFLRPDGAWEAPTKPDTSFVYSVADLSPLLA